jgi:SAM-dependent methyltransferase
MSDMNFWVRILAPEHDIFKGGLDNLLQHYVTKNFSSGNVTRYFDAGCGIGCALTASVAAYKGKGLKAYGADIQRYSKEELPDDEIRRLKKESQKHATQHNIEEYDPFAQNFHFRQEDITDIRYSKKFDIITAMGVMMYLDDPLGGTLNLYNQLKKTGILFAIYTFPNNQPKARKALVRMLDELSALGGTVYFHEDLLEDVEETQITIAIRRSNNFEFVLNALPSRIKVTNLFVANSKKSITLQDKVVTYENTDYPIIERKI